MKYIVKIFQLFTVKYQSGMVLLIVLSSCMLFSCSPEDYTLGEPIPESDVDFSVTQQSGFDNNVFLENKTPNSIAYWEYQVGSQVYTSTRAKDTITLIFPGTYTIKFKAFGQGGASEFRSTEVTVSSLCDDCIDLDLVALTNGLEGRYWRLFRVSLGPAAPTYSAAWGEPSWWDPSVFHYDDSAYFDLNNGYNYTRYHEGTTTTTGFLFNSNDPMSGTVFAGQPNKSISILGNNQLLVKDGSGEMAPANKSKYRIYRLDADTLVLGQGAYYTADRPSEDWSYFHWYVSVK